MLPRRILRPVSSNSPQKELDFKPTVWWAFFSFDEIKKAAGFTDDTQVRALTWEQKVIAEYWADGPSPELAPGHWKLFALFVSERDKHGDDEDVKLCFALSNAG